MPGVQFLHNVSLFANLPATELEPLAERFITRKYRAGEQIFAQGSPGNSLYIVKTGLINVDVPTQTGEMQVIAQFGPGQAFGEFGLLDGLPRSAGAVAHLRSELMILTRPEFFLYLEKSPTIAINLVVLLSRRLRFALQRTEDDIIETTPTLVRLARLLVDLVDRYGNQQDEGLRLALRITQGELAGIIGCPRAEAESALATLREKGLVDERGLQMTIHNLAELRAIAEQS